MKFGRLLARMPIAALTRFVTSKQPVTVQAMLAVGIAGLCTGCIFGYLMMGTMHAVCGRKSFCLLCVGGVRAQCSCQTLSWYDADDGLQLFEMGVETHVHHHQAIYAPGKDSLAAQRQAQSAQGARIAPALHMDGLLENGKTFHTICTSNGSPYVNFQNRIMYGTYKMAKNMPGGENMVAFTRILHRTLPDVVMQVCSAPYLGHIFVHLPTSSARNSHTNSASQKPFATIPQPCPPDYIKEHGVDL